MPLRWIQQNPPAPPPVSRVVAPPRLEGRAVVRRLRDEDFMNRNPTILSAVSVTGAITGLNKITGTDAGVTGQGSAIVASVMHYYKERNAAGELTATQMGPFGVHGLVDPTGPPSRQVLVWEDLVQLHRTAGVAMQVTAGFVDNVTANTFTTKTGIGFYFDAAGTSTWHCFVIEASAGFVAPFTSLYDVDTGLGGLSNDPNPTNIRRLCIVLDGRFKRIRWYVDGALAGEYLYTVAPGVLAGAAGVLLRYRAFVPAATTSRIRQVWGNNWHMVRGYELVE